MTSDKQTRKETPVFSGVLAYFPDAIAEVARVSYVGNQQHNPGEPLHWAREKSKDHEDCIARHLMEHGTRDTDGCLHSAKVVWRALAMCQLEIEKERAEEHATEILDQAGYLGPTAPSAVAGLQAKYPNGFKADTCTRVYPAAGNMEAHDYRVKPTDLIDKTDPHKPKEKKRIYISGPMRGVPEYNFPTFDAARDKLLKQGYIVTSPADMDRMFGHTTNLGYAKRDTTAIFACDEMYMLPGWVRSIGAYAEHALARWIGLNITYEPEATGAV